MKSPRRAAREETAAAGSDEKEAEAVSSWTFVSAEELTEEEAVSAGDFAATVDVVEEVEGAEE